MILSSHCGLFFGSVHTTLNHLVVVDEIWARRLSGEGPEHRRLDAEVETDRERLCERLLNSAARWRQWLDTSSDQRLDEDFGYQNLAGQQFRLPVASTILHAVNHGTHHRGQISAVLTAKGLDAPVMDLPYFLLERGR